DMTTTMPILETTTPTTPPVAAPKPELTARHQAAIAGLPEDQRALVLEAVTVNLDHVKNDLFRKPTAERELFDEGLPIQAASTSWYHPMVDDELIAHSAPSSSLLTTEQEKHMFLRYNYARMRADAAV